MNSLLSPEWYREGWTARSAIDGTLPPRYRDGLAAHFEARISPHVQPGTAVLDVGAGCGPTLADPAALGLAEYVGLDVSRAELAAAPAGAYSSTVVSDIADRSTALECRFDVILSWQVFEHVRDMQAAADNCRAYLRPGGRLFAVLSGKLSAIGILNTLLPHRAAVVVNQWLVGRDPASIFPAYYDRCTSRGLQRTFGVWRELVIEPRYIGAGYFKFAAPVLRSYLAIENRVARADCRNLATHYLLEARR